MKSITLEEFKGFGPCWLKTPEGREKLESIGRRKERWTAVDILDLPEDEASAEDKIWAVTQTGLIEDEKLHEFACRCAEEALKRVDNPDPRSVAAIEAKRKWLRGEISDEELAAAWSAASSAAWSAASSAAWAAASSAARDAARAAARDAARSAASSAASAAAWAAASSAARDAAWSAASDAAWKKQVDMLRELLAE